MILDFIKCEKNKQMEHITTSYFDDIMGSLAEHNKIEQRRDITFPKMNEMSKSLTEIVLFSNMSERFKTVVDNLSVVKIASIISEWDQNPDSKTIELVKICATVFDEELYKVTEEQIKSMVVMLSVIMSNEIKKKYNNK